jgi:hypothetical protein
MSNPNTLFDISYSICQLNMIPFSIFVPKVSGLGPSKYVRKLGKKALFPSAV